MSRIFPLAPEQLLSPRNAGEEQEEDDEEEQGPEEKESMAASASAFDQGLCDPFPLR